MLNKTKLSKTEQVVFKLIYSDLQFLYLFVSESEKITPSYNVAAMPYMGMIIDGCEKWTNKVKSIKNYTIQFSDEEKDYYTLLRNSIKLWETSPQKLDKYMAEKYEMSDNYFSEQCKPIAKIMKLYDIYGAYLINGHFCDNTILDSIFAPKFNFGQVGNDDFRKYIKNMSMIAGKFIKQFGVLDEAPLEIKSSFYFEIKDYGGIVNSPVGNNYSSRFLLFSILCMINFVIWGIDKLIVSEIPTKLRLAYVLYYYLVQQIPKINKLYGTTFCIVNNWVDEKSLFRGSMAHYGLGSVLSQEQVITTDDFGGLTNILFKKDWQDVKASIIYELFKLADQIQDFLNIKLQ